ncbi:MAG TPA: retropepsin-like aspartic protease [Pirellulales bacterium]|nr:retropepsin-like aspartic protease [Pirellulales bacterium]
MRIDGEWRLFTDGATRPVVKADVLDQSGAGVGVRFLVDCGADRTVLTAPVLAVLGLPSQPSPAGTRIEGVSGYCDYVTVRSMLTFQRDDGGAATVRGEFLALTDPQATDLCVLGRDVTDNFDLILSRRRDEVLLLAPTHQYQVVRS